MCSVGWDRRLVLISALWIGSTLLALGGWWA